MKKALFILLIISLGINLQAQIVHPITATSMLNSSGSVYLSDYTDEALNMLSVSLTFNDNNEPSWDVRLKMTIESSTVKIQSKATGTYTPITLYPGELHQLSGNDLYEYFDYNNLESQGIAMSQLSQDGRLPEGTYSFCFEAVDFNSGKAISIPSCNITYVVLYDPPIVQTPQDEITIIPQNPQNIAFQWQDGTPPSYGSSQNTEYTLRVYEVTNNQVSPKAALVNNQVIEVFESMPQASTMLVYNAGMPALDDNKRYVFTVQAEEINGRDVYKNNGLSEPSWFSYGFSTGGDISLITPEDNGAFTKNEQKLFEWNCPTNLASGQNYNYEYEITKINDGQTAEQAIQSNTALHTELTTETSSQGSWSYLLQEEMENSTYYAWQVKAFSGTTEIAASDIFEVKGPPLIEKFIAGGHEVIVRQAYNDDLNNFSGNGDVKFSEDGDIANIDFSGLKLTQSGDRYVLEGGEIASKLTDMDIVLTADYSDNGDALFKTDSLKLDKNRLAISGTVEWDFPLATKSADQSIVISEYTWFNYDEYYLNGGALVSTKTFELSDPMDYTLELDSKSDFLISKNKYLIRFKGNVILPTNIIAFSKDKDIKIPFPTTEQLYYFTNESCEMDNKIQIIENINITAAPTRVIFDFSDDNSPGTLSGDASWKGIYFNEFNLIYLQNLDSIQLKLKDNFFYTHTTGSETEFWLESQGLHFNFEYDFPDENQIQFNTFGGICKKLKLNIDKNQVSSSAFEGAIEILILSTSKLYNFEVPITEIGFQIGDFKSPIEGESFTLNASVNEKKVDVEITRAVFTNHNHLNMTIDIEWLEQNISLSNIPNFCIWGNSNIGFKAPNSMIPLSSQYTTIMEGDFEITLDSIGAGVYKGSYAFVFSSTIALGEDVSGKDGPPQLNLVASEPPKTRVKTIHTPGMGDDDTIDASGGGTAGGDNAGETSSISDLLDAGLQMGLTSDEPGVLAYPYIKINAVVAKFEGHLSIFHEHPDWGTGFHGYLYGKLLLPIAKEMSSHIIMGTYASETYWYISFSMQIGERANQVGSGFMSKTPDGSGKTLKSKKLGKLSGANTLKVGIPMGPVSLTGIEGRVYHNMSHTVINTVLGEEGYSEFEYRPNVDTDFGFLVRASFIDTYSQGAILMYTGAWEATFGGGEGIRSSALDIYLGLGNLFLPGGIINASIMEGTGVGTIDFVNDNVYADIDVNGGLPQLCGQGTLDIELTDDKFDIELGSANAPVYFVPGCMGYALEGWLDVSKKDVFFGAGIRAQIELNSPWIGIGDIASVKPYVGFVAAAGIHTRLTWDPEFQINDVGMWMHASAGVYCKYKWFGDKGEWTLGKVSLAGNFNLHIQPTPVIISGALKGSVEILSVDVNFEVDGSYEF